MSGARKADGTSGGRRNAGSSLLEREAELGAIDEVVEAAATGTGGVLMIEGPAGIGKTSLLDEAADRASRIGVRVLRARGEELEREFPWGVAIQLFGEAVSEPGDELLRGPAGLVRPLFERPTSGPEGPDELFPLIHGLHWLAVNLTEREPVALLIDDAHESDPQSLRFACYLLSRLEGLGAALVLASRPRAQTSGETGPLLDRVRSEARTLEVGALSSGAIEELVRRDLPGASGEFCEAFKQATGGNAFLSRELLEELKEEGIEPGHETAARLEQLKPDRVRSSILLRLGRLGSPARRLAAAIAVLGPGASSTVAAELAGLDSEEVSEAADALAAADLLGSGSALELAHPVVAEVIREDLPANRLRRDHLAAARALRRHGAAAEEVSSHLLLADRPPEPWIVETLREAAEQATSRAAPRRAAQLLDSALEAGVADADRGTLLSELGQAEAAIGDPAAAGHLRDALALARPEQAPAIALSLGQVLYGEGQFEDAVRAFEEGLDRPQGRAQQEEDEVLEAELLVGLNMAGLLSAARPEHVRARAASIRTQPPAAPTLAERVLMAFGAAELALGTQRDPEGAPPGPGAPSRRVLELVDGALGEGMLPGRLGAIVVEPTTLALIICDEYARTRAVLDRVVEHAQRRGMVTARASVLPIRGICGLRSGQLAQAAADAAEAITLLGEGPAEGQRFLSPARYVLAAASLALGDEKAAGGAVDVPAAEQTPDISPLNGWLLDGVGRVALARGDAEAALRAFQSAGEHFSSAGGEGAYCDWRSGAALAARAAGRVDEARELAVEERRLAEEFGAPRAIAISLRCQAALAEHSEEGIELLERAVAVLDGSEAELERALSMVDLGAALRRASRRRECREPLREGIELARRCGAAPLLERANAELVASGARRPDLALRGVGSLTPSELRVARMAASGMGNREIAEALFVTRKTVEVHLSNTYRKLEIGSRTELPGALGEDGEAEP